MVAPWGHSPTWSLPCVLGPASLRHRRLPAALYLKRHPLGPFTSPWDSRLTLGGIHVRRTIEVASWR